jgi:hypothetical protein
MKEATRISCSIRWEGSGFPCTQEHLDNQEWALESWKKLGYDIARIKKQGKVYCYELVEQLLNCEVGIHIDSDIILTEKIKKVVEFVGKKQEPCWAASHRYNFNYNDYPNYQQAGFVEAPYGVAVFVGNQKFWEMWSKAMNKEMCKFGFSDDSAILSWGNRFVSEAYDFTDLKCVFHPRHDNLIVDRNAINEGLNLDTSHCGIPEKRIV